MRLLDETSKTVDSTVTDKDGAYSFAGPEAGTYVVWFIRPDGFEFTLQDTGEDDELDSDARQANGQTNSFAFDGSDMTRDAGLIPSGGPTPVPPKATPKSSATSEATATPEPAADTPIVDLTYHHTVPGQYSEVIIRFSNLAPGQQVPGQVLGPAVDGDGRFTAVGGVDGMCEIRVKIFQFGTYDVDIPSLGSSQAINVTAEEPAGN